MANGCEDMEAVCPIDLFRRVGIEVITVGVGSKNIVGSRGIRFETDISTDELPDILNAEAVVLPGGLPGTYNLRDSARVTDAVMQAYNSGAIVAAICAAPIVLKGLGLLEGRRATVNPDFRDVLGDSYVGGQTVRDGNIITAEAAGAAVPFGLEVIAALKNKQTADSLKAAIYFK